MSYPHWSTTGVCVRLFFYDQRSFACLLYVQKSFIGVIDSSHSHSHAIFSTSSMSKTNASGDSFSIDRARVQLINQLRVYVECKHQYCQRQYCKRETKFTHRGTTKSYPNRKQVFAKHCLPLPVPLSVLLELIQCAHAVFDVLRRTFVCWQKKCWHS